MSDQTYNDADMLACACKDLRDLAELARCQDTPAEFVPFTFNGEQNLFQLDDDVGSRAAKSYGIFNPVEAKVYFSQGGPATEAAGALPVPARSALILPASITGHVRLGIDAGELGAESATIYRLKFATVQPFFLGGL